MKCREFTGFIADYLDGALGDEQLALFERHLSRCENCRAYLSNYRATIAAGQQAFADENADLPADVPEDLVQAILSARPR